MKRLTCILLLIALLTPLFGGCRKRDGFAGLGHLLPPKRSRSVRSIRRNATFFPSTVMVYEGLVTIDDEGLPEPLLAESWTVGDDGKTWTFTLRENLLFSDGTPLTAADVAASGQYILDIAKNGDITIQGFYRNIQYMVSKFYATDERTLVVTTASARPYFGLLYAMTFPVVPAAQVDMAAPYGSGPYKFGAFEPANSYMWLTAEQVLVAVRAAGEGDRACPPSPATSDLITAYEYARVDTAFTRSVSASQYKSGVSSLSVTYSTRQLETLLMNFNEIPLDNLNVRRAIRAAIDNKLISNNVYMGMTIDTDTPIPPSSWLYYDQELVYQYDLELAAAASGRRRLGGFGRRRHSG